MSRRVTRHFREENRAQYVVAKGQPLQDTRQTRHLRTRRDWGRDRGSGTIYGKTVVNWQQSSVNVDLSQTWGQKRHLYTFTSPFTDFSPSGASCLRRLIPFIM